MSGQLEVQLREDLFVRSCHLALACLDAHMHQLALRWLLEPVLEWERLLVGLLKKDVNFPSYLEGIFKTYRAASQLVVAVGDVARGVVRRSHFDARHPCRHLVEEGRVGLLGLGKILKFLIFGLMTYPLVKTSMVFVGKRLVGVPWRKVGQGMVQPRRRLRARRVLVPPLHPGRFGWRCPLLRRQLLLVVGDRDDGGRGSSRALRRGSRALLRLRRHCRRRWGCCSRRRSRLGLSRGRDRVRLRWLSLKSQFKRGLRVL